MRTKLILLSIVFPMYTQATEISCVGQDTQGDQAEVIAIFQDFPNKPLSLNVNLKNKTKIYKINKCEIYALDESDELADVDCEKQVTMTPDLKKFSLHMVHVFGKPSDTDELGFLIGSGGGSLQGFFYNDAIDYSLELKSCSVQ